VRIVVAIVFAVFLMYGTFSTLFHETALVGNVGKKIGDGNLHLFGYLAYIDFLLLFYPLYRFTRTPSLLKRLDGYVGWLLFFLSLIVLQPLLVGAPSCGWIGKELHETLLPFIGLAGLWLFWIMTFSLSLALLIEEEWNLPDRLYSLYEAVKIRIFSRTKGEPPRKSSGKKVRKKRAMPELSFAWVRRIFRNPFNPEKAREVERILAMDLDPIEVEVESETSGRNVPEASRAAENGACAVNDLLRYKERLEETKEQAPQWTEESENEEGAVSGGRQKVVDSASSTRSRKRKSTKRQTKQKASGGVEIVQELEENSRLLAQIDKGKMDKPKNFRLPRLDFLTRPPRVSRKVNEVEIDRKIGELLDKLGRFRIEGDVIRTYTGPLVTTFEFKPAPNVKVSKILNLQDDLAMALSAETIRIQAPIPGRDVVGIEIPNETFETIYLREILESDLFKDSKSPLTVALGKDIVGNPFVTDLKKLPHLLIAGTTGSGKSVGINAMLLSLLYRNDPDHLKLILIDPKMLEFSIYNDIPHLLTPVIVEPKKAISALANMVREMERRYKVMAECRVKNIDNYNEKALQEGWETMPFIVVVIDELADLMMTGGKEVEYSIARLAQMARAAGIHLIVATQRPSVDVVTGLIKANLPSRLSYRVGQRVDSKVILDQMGAESLLGRGDALFTPPGAPGVVRLHAPWSSEEEIEKVVEFLKSQREPRYDESYLVEDAAAAGEGDEDASDLDPLYARAKEIVLSDKKTSISYLQRKLQIGYNRSANLIEQLERMGVLSAPNAKGNREILLP